MSWLDYINPFKAVVSSVERVASELIETDKESAEAKAVILKATDPNGIMRREISRKVLSLYSLYIVIMIILLTLEFLNFVPAGTSIEQMEKATSKLVELFNPITTMVGVIVGASFGVNWQNTRLGK